MKQPREPTGGLGVTLRATVAGVVAIGPGLFLVIVLAVAAFRPAPPDPPGASPTVPVLLVPGWYQEAADLAPLARRLRAAGWPADHVHTINFQDPVGSNEAHAVEVAAAVERIKAQTGARQVDVVAHSMGGLAVRRALSEEPVAASVRRAVFLGTPQRGTWVAYLAWGDGGQEMEPESEFLARLNQQNPVPDTVEALTIRTPVDTYVVPGLNATLPGVADVEVCCPSHSGLVDNDNAFYVVHVFLRAGLGAVPEGAYP